jgi:hypothetical protein
MPTGVSQAINSAAQDILALVVLVIGVLGVAALVSDRARTWVFDRMLGEVIARASRMQRKEGSIAEAEEARTQRIGDAVKAISRGLMYKSTIVDRGNSQLSEWRNAQSDALAGVTTLQAEYPNLRGHFDKVISLLTDSQTHVDAVLVSRDYIQPILDATGASQRG